MGLRTFVLAAFFLQMEAISRNIFPSDGRTFYDTRRICSGLAGLQKLSDREYLGTIQDCKIGIDYAAVSFEGKISLHLVGLVDLSHLVVLLLLVLAM